MPFAKRLSSFVAILALCLSPFGIDRVAAVQSNDEEAVRALAQEFFSRQARKDLDGFLSLWSTTAPELAARRQATEKLFADHEKIEVKSFEVRKVKIEGGKAAMRVAVEMSATETKTGKPSAAFSPPAGKRNRSLECVKEEGRWKVVSEMAAEEELAAALAAAKSEEEQGALLASGQELVNAELGKALVAQGNQLRGRGEYAGALAIYRLAESAAERIGDKAGLVQALINAGNVYYLQNNFDHASENYRKSLALGEAAGDALGTAQALQGIGLVHARQGDFTPAIEYYGRSLALYESLGDKLRIARTLSNIGFSLTLQGNYTEALDYCQRGMDVFEELKDKPAMALSQNYLGLIRVYQGDYARARDHFQKSLALAEELGDKAATSGPINNLGLAYYRQGDYARALEYYRRSLALSEAAGNKLEAAVMLYNIGNIHTAQGDYAQALEYCRRSLALSEADGNKGEIANALNNLGNVYQRQGDYPRALDCYRKSMAVRDAAGIKAGAADVLRDIGVTYFKQGHADQAAESLQRSLALGESEGSKREAAAALAALGELRLSQGDAAQALQLAERAAAIAGLSGERELLWAARTAAGRAYGALGQPAQARQALDEAIATVEALRNDVAGGEQEEERFLENKLSPWQAMVALLVAQNRPEEALGYAERAKARVLLDVLSSGRINITKAMTAQEQQQERQRKAEMVAFNTQIARENQRPRPDADRLADLKAKLQKARLDYEAFQTNLYAAHPQLKAQRGQARAMTLAEARELLPDAHSTLAEFTITEDNTFLFVLTRNADGQTDLKAYPLGLKRQDLTARVEQFRRQLATRNLGFRESASRLYDLLLRPAEAQLQGKTNLVIVPDGALWNLPFQALQNAGGRFLLEGCALSYAPSLAVLREMSRARKSGEATLLAVGNPSLGGQTVERVMMAHRDEKLLPLPEAEKEVNSLKQVYGARQSRIYIGAEASEARVKAEAGKYRILHLATHGILNDASPMYSHVVLSQAPNGRNEDGQAEDGLLEAWEMMNLDLNADLVVLSACDTARGRVGDGEGVIGMTWALFVAGSPTTVVSQWKVDSAGATALMVEFHRRLQSAKTTKAEALRRAALKLLRTEQYRHPFYWASFVVVGNGF